ncbi:MAG: bacterial Ig-like domain-containing protein [Clostridia bacterium]|nr:bacterial Ig-like domain-containing protein [Clostridia bacterium]
MKTRLFTKMTAVLLALLCVLAALPAAFAADNTGFSCFKTAEMQPDGNVRISLQAFQTGKVPAADIVMVLDVSGSMERSTPVPPDEIDGSKTYYIRYVHRIEIDGQFYNKQEDILVHNTAPAGETPTWYGQLEPDQEERLIRPGDGKGGTYVFYTGAMEALRASATQFAKTVAQFAALYEADHRIAVVEFSSPEKKNGASRGTHELPYYANILTGDGTPAGALRSAKDCEAELCDVFAALTADGPTYSDDAMAQAEAILNASTAERRVAILFTDGGPGSYGWMYDADSSALSTANGAIAAAGRMKQSGVQIYTIGVFNEENLQGTVGEKNTTYLSLVSSDYPDAASMSEPGERAAGAYCSIGDLNMDLSAVFTGISGALGVPVERAQVSETLSKYFCLTDAQKQALREAYPGVRITENSDGTTRISLDAVNFPPVAAHADGTAVDPQAEGVFNMTFDATRRTDFLGGDNVPTGTGQGGVFTDGVQIGSFPAQSVTVPVSEDALDRFLQTRDVTLYAGQTLRAQDLYEDRSGDPAASYAALTYSVTDPQGRPFTQAVVRESGTYTVSVQTTVGGTTYTRNRATEVTVLPDAVDRLEVVSVPVSTYFVGQSVRTDGMSVYAWMKSGRAVRLDPQQVSVSPAVLQTAGAQTVTLTYDGVQTTFTVQVRRVEAERAEVIHTPDHGVFRYKSAPDFSGLVVRVYYNDDSYRDVTDLSQMTVRADSSARVRRGTQTFRVSTHGVSATFPMQVKLVWWQWLVLILLFGWIWY